MILKFFPYHPGFVDVDDEPPIEIHELVKDILEAPIVKRMYDPRDSNLYWMLDNNRWHPEIKDQMTLICKLKTKDEHYVLGFLRRFNNNNNNGEQINL